MGRNVSIVGEQNSSSVGCAQRHELLPGAAKTLRNRYINVEFTRMQLKEKPVTALAQIEGAAPPQRSVTPKSVAWMILAGFVVRLLYILLAHSYRFRTNDANFSFGWEIGR